jgi:hypothetical protein
MDPKRRLSNIDVLYISLVDKGANMKKIVFKSDNLPEDPPISKIVEILKTDVDKKMVYGIVYSPEETDSQGDVASESEIEKAAHGFMKYRRSGKIDKMHNMEPEQGFTAETWITRENDALLVKKEEITGLSLMGSANTEQLEKSQDSWLERLIKKIGLKKGTFAEKIKASQARRMMWDFTDAFSEAVREVFSDDFKGDKKEALLEIITEIQEYVEKEFPGELVKAGRVISTLNTKKIQDAIDALNNLLESAKVEKMEESEMTDEDKKIIADMITKGNEDLKKDLNEQFDKTVGDIKDSVEKHEKTFVELSKSKGSEQQSGQETDDEKEAVELEKQGKWKDKETGKIRTHVFA